MLLRMFISSARRFRPSIGASPATLLAVVLGCVSESCAAAVSLGRTRERLMFCIPCNQVCRGCTAIGKSACLLSLTIIKHYYNSANTQKHSSEERTVCTRLTHPEFFEAIHLVVLVLHFDIFMCRGVCRRGVRAASVALARHVARVGYSPRLGRVDAPRVLRDDG